MHNHHPAEKMKSLIFCCALAALSGCQTLAIPRYTVSTDTVVELRKYRPLTVNVGPFAATSVAPTNPERISGMSTAVARANARTAAAAAASSGNEIMCRGIGPAIRTPDGESFSDYIRKALVSELAMAEIYASTSANSLSGTLTHADFSTTSGDWTLTLTLKSSDGAVVGVTDRYSFVTSIDGAVACGQAAQAAMGAVQNLLLKAVTHQDFKKLLTTTQ